MGPDFEGILRYGTRIPVGQAFRPVMPILGGQAFFWSNRCHPFPCLTRCFVWCSPTLLYAVGSFGRDRFGCCLAA